jgi:RNA polymerase primary sigma factor
MQTVLGSEPMGLRPASGRTRVRGGVPRVSVPAVGAAPDEGTRALIHRRWRGGFSIDVLAEQFHLSRSGIERVINEVRAARLLATKLEFMADPSFDEPAAVAEILRPTPEPGSKQRRVRSTAPEGLPSYLASLYDVPLLSPEQERSLFRQMNYFKYRAHQLREGLDPARCDAALLDEIERLQAEALAIKNRIIGANLRLVVSIAKKYARPTNNLFELISDGNMSLIRAVEKFDVARGFKFSTYATWAIAKNFSRTIPEETYRRNRYVTGHSDLFEAAADDRGDAYQQESDHRRSQEIVREMLGGLTDRERRILVSRYGIGGADKQTLQELGRELRITKERVRQIEVRARDKLRRMGIAQRLDLPFDISA